MLLVTVVLASITIAANGSRGATSITAPAGQPIYQFRNSGSGPLPWNAASLEGKIDHTTMLGAPHAASDAIEGVLAYRTNLNQLALFTQTSTGATTWTNLSTPKNSLPPPSTDPIPFFDPSGNVDLLYIDDVAHVILLSQNDPVTPFWRHLHGQGAWRPFVATDLSALTGATAANGLPSILVNGLTATVAFRTTTSTIEVLQVGWSTGQPVPFMTSTPGSVTVTAPPVLPITTTTKPVTTTTKAGGTTTTTKPKSTTTTTKPVTTTTKPVTTTTLPASSVTVASDPIVIPGPVPSFVTTSNVGDLLVYTNIGASLNSWSVLDVSSLTAAPKVAGTLAMSYDASDVEIAALTSSGSVELFASPNTTSPGLPTPVWSASNVTGDATGAPPLSGSIFVNITPTETSIDGQAANWGDLFSFTNALGSSTWSATDVSATGGSSARTVGDAVTGIQFGTTLTLYAAGVNSPPPQGVGVYAIPSSKWATAITDGWPIVSETGGLGTRSSPWVGFTSSSSVATSPDFLMGQSIYNSHKRVTWLSFWTASGPLKGQPMTTTNYYDHGFAAGAWVATQIDQYRSLGVGLKPDWVIFDPEGYPDNHSGLDAPGGSSNATLAKYATYWSSMLSGWASGMASVDPSLNAAVYASQSEYRNYDLVTQSMPVFEAIAFGNGGPTPIGGATGSNIRGYISFAASCTPKATLASEESTLVNPPWSGQFNTLQFNAGVYCAPAAP